MKKKRHEIVSQVSFHCLPRLRLLATTVIHTIIHSLTVVFAAVVPHHRLGTPTVSMARRVTGKNQARDVITGQNESDGFLIWGKGREGKRKGKRR